MKENTSPKVTIGLPVFNGEKFIQKRLDSILNQTYSDFEVIISDNASTDKTEKICQDYLKKDSRIRYIRHEKTIGGWENFQFVINNVVSKYFVWVAVDDWWEPKFLEKNVSVLDSDFRLLGSISKIEYDDRQKFEEKKPKLSKIKRFYSYDEYSQSGKYEDRIKFYLRLNTAENIYSVFRTDVLRKHSYVKQMAGFDSLILFGILKEGEINVLDEVLMHRSHEGISGSNDKNRLTKFNKYGILGKIFPFLPFSIWIAKNLGLKVLIQNLDYLLFMNLSALKYQIKHGFK